MKIRLKFHAYPGDIPLRNKIAMMENHDDILAVEAYGGLKTQKKRRKSFKQMICSKERAVLKRQVQNEIKNSTSFEELHYRNCQRN